MDVKKRIKDNLQRDQNAVERALVVLDDRNLWNSRDDPLKTGPYKRAQYLASWVRSGKKLSGKFVEEARKLVLEHVGVLVQPSLDKARLLIKDYEKRILNLKDWVKACEDELSKLPFEEDAPELPKPEESGKPIWEICSEEGLY